MRIEHINLVVRNIEKSLAFYRAAFPHWYVRSEGTSEWYGKSRRWLHFGDDFQYLAFSDNGESENRDLTGHQIGLAHFAFETSCLLALTNRLSEAGFTLSKPGTDNKYRMNSYYIDPAGFEVEFVEYLTDVPAQRNNED